MDVRDRLLHNEIQNLGQMIQIVSYELTLLSDFMKERFGPSYDSFREKHSQQNNMPQSSHSFAEPERVLPKKKNLTARKSCSQIKRNHGQHPSMSELKRMKIDNQDENEQDLGSDDGVLDDFGNSADDMGFDDTSFMLSGDEDGASSSVIEPTDIPQGAKLLMFNKKDPDEKSLGRARDDIWKKYIVSKLPNGKLHAVCPRCKNPVSSKVERLTAHYRKCVMGQRQSKTGNKIDSSFKIPSQIEEEDKKKVKKYIKAMSENRHGASGEDLDESTPSHSQVQLNDSTSSIIGGSGGSEVEGHEVTHDHTRGGRKLDPVWEYFKIIENPETKKRTVKCKRCDVIVSSKVERVRRHFVICQELDKEGDGGGDDRNSTHASIEDIDSDNIS